MEALRKKRRGERGGVKTSKMRKREEEKVTGRKEGKGRKEK